MPEQIGRPDERMAERSSLWIPIFESRHSYAMLHPASCQNGLDKAGRKHGTWRFPSGKVLRDLLANGQG